MSELVASFADNGEKLLKLRKKIAESLKLINSIHSAARSDGFENIAIDKADALPQTYKTIIQDSEKEIELVEQLLKGIQEIQNDTSGLSKEPLQQTAQVNRTETNEEKQLLKKKVYSEIDKQTDLRLVDANKNKAKARIEENPRKPSNSSNYQMAETTGTPGKIISKSKDIDSDTELSVKKQGALISRTSSSGNNRQHQKPPQDELHLKNFKKQELFVSSKMKKNSSSTLNEANDIQSAQKLKQAGSTLAYDKKKSSGSSYLDSEDDLNSLKRSKYQNSSNVLKDSKSKYFNGKPVDLKSKYSSSKYDSSYTSKSNSYEGKRKRDNSWDEPNIKNSKVKPDLYNTTSASHSNDNSKTKSTRQTEDLRSRSSTHSYKYKDSFNKSSKIYADDKQDSNSSQYLSKSTDFGKLHKENYDSINSPKKQKIDLVKHSSGSYNLSHKSFDYERDKKYANSSKHNDNREYSKHGEDKYYNNKEYLSSTRTGEFGSPRDYKNSESAQKNSERSKNYLPDSTKPSIYSRSNDKESDSSIQNYKSLPKNNQSRSLSAKQESTSSPYSKNNYEKNNHKFDRQPSFNQDKHADNLSAKRKLEMHKNTSRSGTSSSSGSATVNTTTSTNSANSHFVNTADSNLQSEKADVHQRRNVSRDSNTLKQADKPDSSDKISSSRTRNQGLVNKYQDLERVKTSADSLGIAANSSDSRSKPHTPSSGSTTRMAKVQLESQITIGSLVAAKIPVDGGGEQADEWVLGIVRRINTSRTKFVVEDADDDESVGLGAAAKAQYELDQRNVLFVTDPIIPVQSSTALKNNANSNLRRKSQTSMNSSNTNSGNLAAESATNIKSLGQGDKARITATQAITAGQRVLGIYPGTTVFYHGTVQLTPAQNRTGYSLFMASVPHLGLPPVVMSLIERWSNLYPFKHVFQVIFDNDEGKLIDVPAIMIIKNPN
ncbi:hypothetical protein BB561_003681 [Smittium simulii]|uniref:SGF29 C-terminal domain-containing protein n=1 Tax=Smittium simulii TaxID=133385 RepID=A0A2T9YK24_9FUNG|nr:hypothetical protein BB561_006251 [Smittium simulii]PVU92669.1 hypothetical protein BB561_003681 [Smittium simulii]